MKEGITRVLIVHPDAETRREVERALRRASSTPLAVEESDSLAEGFQTARQLDPRLLFLDLSEDRQLALEVVRGARSAGRLIVGLYNPLVVREIEAAFFRAATRAGVGDFVPVPVAQEEIEAVLAAVTGAQKGTDAAEGRVAAFVSPKGGVGTTTLAVSTALVLAASDLVDGEVALLDADVQLGDALAHLGLAAQHDLSDLTRDLDSLRTLSPYLAAHDESSLRILGSPRDPIDGDRITPEELGRVVIALRRRFRFVVVDVASTLDLLTLTALELSEVIFVVTEAMAPTVLATRRYLDLLAGQGLSGDRVRVVLNRSGGGGGRLSDELVAERLGRAPDHEVPDDPNTRAAINRGAPLVIARQESPFAEGVARIAEAAAAVSARPVDLAVRR